MSTKLTRQMLQPQNLLYRLLQSKARIQVWLFDQTDMRIEGTFVGFDEYMNMVLDEAEEVHQKKKERRAVGRILLKGDNVTLVQSVPRVDTGAMN